MPTCNFVAGFDSFLILETDKKVHPLFIILLLMLLKVIHPYQKGSGVAQANPCRLRNGRVGKLCAYCGPDLAYGLRV